MPQDRLSQFLADDAHLIEHWLLKRSSSVRACDYLGVTPNLITMVNGLS